MVAEEAGGDLNLQDAKCPFAPVRMHHSSSIPMGFQHWCLSVTKTLMCQSSRLGQPLNRSLGIKAALAPSLPSEPVRSWLEHQPLW